ncbi:hydrogenase expression/formation protein HypE [Halobaculum sp. MBLA0143]|uniref:hydrogenase expression/formation protein HypE n=1 Tax=Halobaculum sp. MBLA0143 TaxID=3079933 RepID=UPI0035254546
MSEEVVTAAHGAGTEATADLVDRLLGDRFGGGEGGDAGDGDAGGAGGALPAGAVGLAARDDGAVVPDATTGDETATATVVSTDSHVVQPPVFPGGDVGRLAAAGTVNDLAAMGATDGVTLSSALVIPAGTPVDTVETVTASMAAVCETAGCTLRTGDTKVVGADELDGLVVTTTGVARVDPADTLPASGLSPGDRLVVTGPVGDHGVALLAAREGFDFETAPESDAAPTAGLLRAAREAGEITAATDPTRGGLANAVNELAAASDAGVVLDEETPVADDTRGAAEVLGVDPLTVACEGRLVVGVDADDAETVVDRLRDTPGGEGAAVIGRVVDDHPGDVVLDTGIGRRYLSVPTGERVPRIC